MSPYRCTHLLYLLALVGLTACSSRVVDSDPGAPATDEVPFSMVVDVRNNLLKHYTDGIGAAAAKPYAPEPVVRFDFREISRNIGPTQASVAGEFLFVVDDGPLRQGRITVVFAVQGIHWTRTGEFAIDEVPVATFELPLLVRHSTTAEPLTGVLAEARRVEDGVRSSAVRTTDARGAAVLHVLEGVFQIRVSRDGYGDTLSDYVTVSSALDVPIEFRLRPDGSDAMQL